MPRCQISTSFLFLFHQFLFRSFKFASLLSYPSAYTYTDRSPHKFQIPSSNSRSVLSLYFSSTQCESTEVYWIQDTRYRTLTVPFPRLLRTRIRTRFYAIRVQRGRRKGKGWRSTPKKNSDILFTAIRLPLDLSKSFVFAFVVVNCRLVVSIVVVYYDTIGQELQDSRFAFAFAKGYSTFQIAPYLKNLFPFCPSSSSLSSRKF